MKRIALTLAAAAVMVAMLAAMAVPAFAAVGRGNSLAAHDCPFGPRGVHGECVSTAAQLMPPPPPPPHGHHGHHGHHK